MAKTNSKVGVSAFILLVSGVVCKALGALFRLPLTNLLGIEGIGVFQLVMSLYSFALVLTCGGVTNALSKLISSARAKGEGEKISVFMMRAVVTGLVIGMGIGLVFLAFSKLIAAFQSITAWSSYMLFVVLLPLGAGLAALRGFFQGHENMVPTAISQILEQVFKFAFGLLFAYYFGRFGISQGVFGAFLGIVLSEIVALVYLFVLFLIRSKKRANVLANDLAFSVEASGEVIEKNKVFARKQFDKANFPLMLSASVLPLVNAFDGLVIVARLKLAGFSAAEATQLFGLQAGVVGAILNFPLIISVAVTTTLLPNISYLISRGTGGKFVIERGLKILLFLILPTTFGMVAISKVALALVYVDMTPTLLFVAFWLMFYGAFSIILTALMQYFVMLLQANGKFNFILVVTAVGGLVKAALSFLLASVPSVNIFALVIGNIAMSGIVCTCAIVKLKKDIAFSIGLGDVLLLLFATLVMFVAVFCFLNFQYFHPIVNLIVGVLIGVLTYAVLTAPFIIKIVPKLKNKTPFKKSK